MTRTPALTSKCPEEKQELVLDSYLPGDDFLYINQSILEFLNSGGTRKSAITAVRQHQRRADAAVIQEKEVTGDGIPELLFTELSILSVYVCSNGLYQLHMPVNGTYHDNQPYIVSIEDLNLDGVDEIITIAGDDRYRSVDVLEWDGSEFQNLNLVDVPVEQSCSGMLGPSSIDFADIDGNGTRELILKQAIPIWSEYIEGLPWRKETRICTWNGEKFVWSRTEFTSPEYRFQAVQDGDRAALAGEYDRANDLYQQTIFNDQLDWWSPDRKEYETQLALPDPGPQPTPVLDTIEYSYLASYARFRILLLHTLRGYMPEAKTVYDTLQIKFPDRQPGHEFAQMALHFWNEFQISSDMSLACSKAIEYARDNPSILNYLGSAHHGWQSHTYSPGDVCPFISPP